LATIELAHLNSHEGKYEEAIGALEQVSTRRNDNVGAEAQYTIGDIYFDNGTYVLAEKAFLRVEYVYPESVVWIAKAYLALGKLYERQSEKEKTKQVLTKLLEKFSGTPEANEARMILARSK